ncbi:MAG: aspartate/glutamate racemase family protein [Anaerolineaceae bacterium]|nr:aspartate/glutamate racemase family protein [Anaerolineaceae bacterium]
MKTIGIIGGMSWESSVEYYRIINEVTKAKLGGLHSAKSVMVSVDFATIEEMQKNNRWGEATAEMINAARQVENGGADFILIATNTMHLMYEEVQQSVNIPILHIADATAGAIQKKGISTVGLLGTVFTMEKEFYTGRLADKFGINVMVPRKVDREIVNNIIYKELVLGNINTESKQKLLNIIKTLDERGAKGIILGCTEIPLLVNEADTPIPLFNTTYIHAAAAVEIALGEKSI